jgi:hypothetical protein
MELAQLKEQRKEERQYEPEETKFYADGNQNCIKGTVA